MSKKRSSAKEQLLNTPISVKKMSVALLIIIGIASMNVVAWKNNEPPPIVTNTDPQTALQQILGSSITLGSDEMHSDADPKQHIEYWTKVISEKPEYVDAYVTLAALYFNNRNCQQTEVYLNKALELDPHNTNALELIPHIRSCL